MSTDKNEKLEFCEKELELKRRKLDLVQQESDRRKIKTENKKQERKTIEEKLKECDDYLKKNRIEAGEEDKRLIGLEKKLQEEIKRVVNVKLKKRVDSYKFEIYRSKVLK